jgi:hypothetical protein
MERNRNKNATTIYNRLTARMKFNRQQHQSAQQAASSKQQQHHHHTYMFCIQQCARSFVDKAPFSYEYSLACFFFLLGFSLDVFFKLEDPCKEMLLVFMWPRVSSCCLTSLFCGSLPLQVLLKIFFVEWNDARVVLLHSFVVVRSRLLFFTFPFGVSMQRFFLKSEFQTKDTRERE